MSKEENSTTKQTSTERFFSRFHFTLLWKGKQPYSDQIQRRWEIRGHYSELKGAQEDIQFLTLYGAGRTEREQRRVKEKCSQLAVNKPITFFGRTFLITPFRYKERK